VSLLQQGKDIIILFRKFNFKEISLSLKYYKYLNTFKKHPVNKIKLLSFRFVMNIKLSFNYRLCRSNLERIANSVKIRSRPEIRRFRLRDKNNVRYRDISPER